MTGKLGFLFLSGAVALCNASNVLAQTDIDQLKQQLQQLEASTGTFGEEIGEVAFQLGRLYEQAGQYDEALQAYQQADQGIKIASGLYAPEREAAIRETFQQNLRLANWDDADAAMRSLGWLQARNMDKTSPAYLPMRKELAAWYLASEFYRLDDNSMALLRKAHEQLQNSAGGSEAPDDRADQEMLELYLAINYRLSLHAPQQGAAEIQMRLLQMERNLEMEVSRAISACYAIHSENQGAARACALRAEQNIRARSPLNDPFLMNELEQQMYGDRFAADALRRGSSAASRWLEQNRMNGSPQQVLDALLLYADWNLTIDRFAAADAAYLEAWQLADSLGLLTQYGFDQPRPLHSWGLAGGFNSIEGLLGDQSDRFRLGMVVTERGRAESVSLLDRSTDSDARISGLANRFEIIRFRPRLQAGVAVETPDFQMIVPLPNQSD